MTKDEYIQWKATRGEPGTWSYADRCAADDLIRSETFKNFTAYLKKNEATITAPVRNFLSICVQARYGLVETDELLTKLQCYPDWM